jgi:hypothetical protein
LLPKQVLGWSLFAAESPDIITQLFWCAHNREWYCRL